MAGNDIAKTRLGAGKVFYMLNGAWVNFGYTTDGGTYTYTPEYADLQTDQNGTTIVKKVLIGEMATLAISALQIEKSIINKAAPFSTVYTSGADTALGFGVNPYGDLLDETIQLKFHPINQKGTSNADDEDYTDDDIIIWKAGSDGALTLAFTSGEFTNIPITFTAFNDDSRNSGIRLNIIGDTATVGYAQTAPALLGTIPDLAGTDIAITVSPIIVMDKQLVADTVYSGDVGVIVESTGIAVAAAVTYGKTLSQIIDSDVTVNNPSAVTSPSSITVATADILAQDDILNGLTIKITEDGNTHTTTISDYTLAGVVTLTVNSPFTFTVAAEYTIYGGFIQINPTASMANATIHSIVLAGLQGKNLLTMATPIANKFTTVA